MSSNRPWFITPALRNAFTTVRTRLSEILARSRSITATWSIWSKESPTHYGWWTPDPWQPAGIGYSYLDWFGAYNMATALVAALLRQRTTGRGCWIDALQTEVGIYPASCRGDGPRTSGRSMAASSVSAGAVGLPQPRPVAAGIAAWVGTTIAAHPDCHRRRAPAIARSVSPRRSRIRMSRLVGIRNRTAVNGSATDAWVAPGPADSRGG